MTCSKIKMAVASNTDAFGIPLKDVNADLVRERKSASFNVQELTHFIDGGPDRTKRRKELGKIFVLRLFRSHFLLCIDLPKRRKWRQIGHHRGAKVAECGQL